MAEITIPRRIETIHEFRREGGSIAAVFPICYPRELLRAFNILPVEVWGPPKIKARNSAAHLQPYVCSIVQNGLSFLQSGGLEIVDLLLIPHACDSLQGLGSLLLDFIRPRQPVLTLYIPRLDRESSVDFLAAELRRLSGRLCEITNHTPTEEELSACVQREEAADALLASLHSRRQELPFSDEALYRLIRSREYLPAEKFSRLVQDALSQPADARRDGLPVLLSGILPEPMSLFAALAEMGGRIAADDLACCGRRLYPAGQSADPFRRMAERIVYAPPDPMRGSPLQDRLEHLLRLAGTSEAKGVIFYDVKFCEPELFELPQLRQGLRQAGLPSLCIEVDLNDELVQPIRNRLEAFLEMLA